MAVTAERSGFDTVFVMDHFFQLPMIGPAEHEMFEAYTLLGALAARTERARLGTLVTGVTYRNPALLAKAVTALDVISGGRALLGIGAAWFDVEHEALDVDFPPVKERFEHLEDALRICKAMFAERQSTVVGTHHRITDAWNVPRPLTPGGPPIMIGGQGEKKTFALAARYADELNTNASFVDIPRKLDALAGHLDRVGRDRSDISVSCLGTIVVGETHDAAEAKLAAMLAERGVADPTEILTDASVRNALIPRLFYGDPDEVAEQVQVLVAQGLDGIAVNMLVDGHDLEAVALAGQTLQKALA
jgi:F420-dependent oxidoreductase-like protein